MKVSVMGFGSAVRIDLEEVLVKAELIYQMMHKTTNLIETGAFNASASSCAFALTLPFRVRIFRIASLRLFCLPCLDPGPTACPFVLPHAR